MKNFFFGITKRTICVFALFLLAAVLKFELPAYADGCCLPLQVISQTGSGATNKVGWLEITNASPPIINYYSNAMEVDTDQEVSDLGSAIFVTTYTWTGFVENTPTVTYTPSESYWDYVHTHSPTGCIESPDSGTITETDSTQHYIVDDENCNEGHEYEYADTTLLDLISTDSIKKAADGFAAAAVAAAPLVTNSSDVTLSAQTTMALSQVSCSRGEVNYYFQFDTEPLTKYKITWQIETTRTGPTATNYSKYIVEAHVLGNGSTMTYAPAPLMPDYPSDPYDTEESAMSAACLVVEGRLNGAAQQPAVGGGGGCSSCGGSTSATTAGSASSAPGVSSGPNLSLALGKDNTGYPVGDLNLNPQSQLQATPALLNLYAVSSNVTPVYSGSVYRQLMMPQVLVDVVSNSPTQFDLMFYDTNNFSTTLSGGVYPVTNGGQFVTWRVENPGGTNDFVHLRIIETRGSHVITNLFTWQTNYPWLGITALLGNGLRQEIWQQTWNSDGSERTEAFEIADASNNAIYYRTDVYDETTGTELLATRTEGLGASARTTSYYYSGSTLQEVDSPDGTYNVKYYDSQGRLTERDWANHQDTFDYTPLGGGDDGSYRPLSPRTTVHYFNGSVISYEYAVITTNQIINAQGPPSSTGWTDSANLATTNNYDGNLYLISTANPDGTWQWFSYFFGTGSFTNVLYSGYATGSGTFITNKVTTNIYGLNNRLMSSISYEDGTIVDQMIYTNYDALSRVGLIKRLDQTTEMFQYDCCGVSTYTNRDGMGTAYAYDDLKRLSTKTEYGYPGAIGWIYNYDPAGHILSNVRMGTNGSTITLTSASYDYAGLRLTSVDGMANTNTFYQYTNSSLHLVKITTNADSGTIIQEFDRDGSLLKVTGTATFPVRYVRDVSGYNTYIKTIKLDASGSDTSEWVQNFSDFMGRPVETLYASASGSPASYWYYNSKGQLTNQTDPDGVITLYAYNLKAERVYSVVDSNQNLTIDFSGGDRITFRTNDIMSDHAKNVHRTKTYVWSTSANASNQVSTEEISTDGTQSFSAVYNNGVAAWTTNITVYSSNGYRYLTNRMPDGSFTINTYLYGKLLSVMNKDANGIQISYTTNSYDAHGRLGSVWDARTGTTTFTFNNADQINSMVTPSPVETTTYYFDSMLRKTGTTEPDGTTTTNLYYLNGNLMLSYGSRKYPVGYAYDAQGRMTKITNWSSIASPATARVTTWAYDSYRGFLSSKTYDSGTLGPAYTYTSAGRLATRLWARGTNTTYSYNTAGDLATVIYNDSFTPGITNNYDRRGRQVGVINNTTVTVCSYNDQNQILSEAYTGGPLDGISITNGYDILLRRTNNVTLRSGTVLNMVTNNYDAISRLSTISDQTNSATYAYLVNSPLVSQIAFKQSGTTRMITTKVYDNLNRLTVITNANASGVALDLHNYAYNSASQRTRATNVDGSYWVYQYDAWGQVTSGVKYWGDGSPVTGQQFGYGFDDIGNRKSTSTGGDEWGGNLRNATYSANSLNQYTSRTVSSAVDAVGTATNTATVTVNNISASRKGNYYRAQLPLTNGSAPVWQTVTNLAVLPIGTNFIVQTNINGNVYLPQTPESFTYDADGNLTQDGRWIYSWDAENRLIAMTNISTVPSGAKMRLDFAYDFKGRRVNKNVVISGVTNATKFVYDTWNSIACLNSSFGLTGTFMWGLDLSGSLQGAGGVGGLLKVTYVGTATTNSFLGFDGNGNVEVLINAADGTVNAEYEYGPFGEVIRATGLMAKANPFQFSTKYKDAESDLDYYGYRYYNPSVGKWISHDPIEENGGLDIYVFLGNDSVNRIDSLGLLAPTVTSPSAPTSPPVTTAPIWPPDPSPAPIADPISEPIGSPIGLPIGFFFQKDCITCSSQHPTWPSCTGPGDPEAAVRAQAPAAFPGWYPYRTLAGNPKPSTNPNTCPGSEGTWSTVETWFYSPTPMGSTIGPSVWRSRISVICCKCCVPNSIRQGMNCRIIHAERGSGGSKPPPAIQ